MSDVHHPTLTPAQRERLRAIARERGLRPTAREIGCSRDALVGVLAGVDSQNGTLALVERWLHMRGDGAPKEGSAA